MKYNQPAPGGRHQTTKAVDTLQRRGPHSRVSNDRNVGVRHYGVVCHLRTIMIVSNDSSSGAKTADGHRRPRTRTVATVRIEYKNEA